MAYDEDLANSLRELLAQEDESPEKKIFGGLAFLLHGHMTVSASRRGGMLVRIHPADADAALALPDVALMRMRGRVMERVAHGRAEGLTTMPKSPSGWSGASPTCGRCRRSSAGSASRAARGAGTHREPRARRALGHHPDLRRGDEHDGLGEQVLAGLVPTRVDVPSRAGARHAVAASGWQTSRC